MRLTFLALAILVASPAFSVTVEIPPVKDNTLFEDVEGIRSNGSGPQFFTGVNNLSLRRRAVFAFDVAGNVPPGAVIMSVELRLFLSNAAEASSRTLMLHLLLADWGEGASASEGGQGASSAPGDATWVHRFFPDVLWSSTGGDFAPAASASFQVTGVGNYEVSGEGLLLDVQGWLDAPETNFGWILIGDETTVQTARRFESRESAADANRPRLVIEFTAVPVVPITWGGIKRERGLGSR